MNDETPRFEFGKNWLDYIHKNFSDETAEISKKHLLSVLDRSDLKGLSFLDIGCGSGLHSYAAWRVGVAKLHSFDFDPNSVAATRYVNEKAGSPSNWTIEQGSVLDPGYMGRLPMFDVVYSWGVLHHTGDVWQAIRNAAGRVKPGGLFYIALYSADVQKDPSPEFWLEVKRRYVSSGWLTRRYMDCWYVWRFMLGRRLSRFPAFCKRAWEYKKSRGMSLFTDIRDWLGGWPMEFVYDADAVKFCEGLGFRKLKMLTGEANTEFVFVKST
ncbi:MAG TPA: class I SAM-dependent methyltransferase [Gammaproteobacteria bacterium]|nr:class I SAM-dependent methyltransferase [Gammaproteobacteria bacterium]